MARDAVDVKGMIVAIDRDRLTGVSWTARLKSALTKHGDKQLTLALVPESQSVEELVDATQIGRFTRVVISCFPSLLFSIHLYFD